MKWQEGFWVLGACLAPRLAFQTPVVIQSFQQPVRPVLLFVPTLQMKRVSSLSKGVVSRAPRAGEDCRMGRDLGVFAVSEEC